MESLIERLERDKQMIYGLRLNRIADDIHEAIQVLKKHDDDDQIEKSDPA